MCSEETKKKKKSRKADQTEVSESTGGAATRDERLRNATHAEKKKVERLH